MKAMKTLGLLAVTLCIAYTATTDVLPEDEFSTATDVLPENEFSTETSMNQEVRSMVKPRCPMFMCMMPPWKCPKDAKIGTPKFGPGNACSGCRACLNTKTKKPVKVGKCWQRRFMCAMQLCLKGQKLALVRKPGKNGAGPCCPTFKCVGRPCPMMRCMMPPWRCPKGSKIGTPKFGPGNACSGCRTCLKKGRRVKVGQCWRQRFFCARRMCRFGQKETLVRKAGSNGASPCCPTYKCVGRPCPMMRCMMPPWKCPEGSKIGTPKFGPGCSGCSTCLSTKTKKAVKVGKCWQRRFMCAMPMCMKGSKLVVSKKAGKNGAEPCCTSYKCVKGPEPCPLRLCRPPPWKCPAGSALGVPKDAKGCSGCTTCLKKGKPVTVGKCWQRRFFCAMRMCRFGQKLVLAKKTGKNGASPCCPTHKCVGRPCPMMRCMMRPWKCPEGSKIGTPKFGNGCSGCSTCLDIKTKKPVKVGKCYRERYGCLQIACMKGYKQVLVSKAGKNGAGPCCPRYRCVGKAEDKDDEDDDDREDEEDDDVGHRNVVRRI